MQWSITGRLLHWLSAGLILFMLALGLVMVEGTADAARRFELYQLHKSCGMLVLGLTGIRALWRLGAVQPPRPPGMSRPERLASRLVHGLIYTAIFALAATGYAMVSASPLPLPVELPGGFSVPNLIAPDFALSEQMKALHHVLAWGMLALVALHVAAALKHHFLDRDDILRAMLPGFPRLRRRTGTRDGKSRD
ncbi:MAG: cytochrome b [Ancalomicrobiaceae bacterium]|nr:cytochrome b [Ancalomicrobiaceae bacterium]